MNQKQFFYFAKIKYFILNVIKIVNSSIREVMTAFFIFFILISLIIKSQFSDTGAIFSENTSGSDLATAIRYRYKKAWLKVLLIHAIFQSE